MPGLRKSLVPVMKRLLACLSETQLDAVVDIAYGNCTPKGAHNKVQGLLEAIANHYSPVDLKRWSKDFKAFTEFLNDLNEIESFHQDGACTIPESHKTAHLSYADCFYLKDELGLERSRELLGNIMESGNNVYSSIHILVSLIDESKLRGFSPEILLDFRRNELETLETDSTE
jgi:hypothetical protein